MRIMEKRFRIGLMMLLMMLAALHIQAADENRSEAGATYVDLKKLDTTETQAHHIAIRNYTEFDAELTDGETRFAIPADGGVVIPCEPDAEYGFSLHIETEAGYNFHEFDAYCGNKFVIHEPWEGDEIKI